MNAIAIPSILALSLLEPGCTKQQLATAIQDGAPVAVTIADNVCQELTDEGGAPEWVTLVCQGVKVLMPRTQWAAIRAMKVDAGPGK